MDSISDIKVQQFASLAIRAGWEFCGVQASFETALPCLVVQRGFNHKNIPFDPDDFDPIKTASLYLVPQEKKMSEVIKLNLRQKLVKVYGLLDHVDKAGRNNKQNYDFVRAADVLRAVRDAFALVGIYAEPNYELLGTYDIKTNSGGNMHTATVKATIVLHDADSSETMTVSGLGDGADSGDKGIFKAQTGSTKNALRNALLLPDEADPEADTKTDEYTDFRGVSEAYAHPPSTMDMPDFQEARHAAPKAAAPRPTQAVTPKTAAKSAPAADGPSQAALYTETPALSGAQPVDAPALGETAQSAAPERGDAYEEPEVAKLPTEQEMVAYRKRFTDLSNDLSTHGKLTASKGLKLNTKLLVFLNSITGADAAKNITTTQWDNFFERVDAAIANPAVGLLGLTKLINKANGIEPKEK